MRWARSPGYLLIDEDGCPELPVFLEQIRQFAHQIICIGLAVACLC